MRDTPHSLSIKDQQPRVEDERYKTKGRGLRMPNTPRSLLGRSCVTLLLWQLAFSLHSSARSVASVAGHMGVAGRHSHKQSAGARHCHGQRSEDTDRRGEGSCTQSHTQ